MSGADSTESTVHVALQLDSKARQLVTERLSSRGLEPRFVSRSEELSSLLDECTWLFIGRPPRIDWSRGARLRLLQIAGAGVDPLFPATGLRDTVWVANCRGAHADAVRDHAVLLLLALARHLPDAVARQSRAEWRSFPAASLRGKTLAVLGLGEVGGRVVEVARVLGLRIRGVCRQPRDVVGVETVLPPQDLRVALSGADYVIVCLPLTRATRHFVDASALSTLPAHAALIDVSRGGIVDQHAVEQALREGRLGSAAFDVFEDEPLPPQSSLWHCPNLVITPHVAGLTPDYIDRALDVFLENLHLVRNGQPPRTFVSREHEY